MKKFLDRALTAVDDLLNFAEPFWQMAIVLFCVAMIVHAIVS